MKQIKIQKIITAAAIIGALLAASTAYAAMPADLVNYWALDEGTGNSVNDSVGGINGVLVGASSGFGWASGKAGTALGFDGATGESVALTDGFLKGSQGSIALWAKVADLSDNNILFSGRSTSDNGVYVAFIIDHDGRPTLISRDVASANDRIAQGMQTLNKNEWYQIVLTADTLGYHIFVNGVDIGVAGDNTGRWIPDITNQTFSYRLGALTSNPRTGVMNGYLDDVRVYGHALTQDEVTALYTETNALRPSLPLAVAPQLNLSLSLDTVSFGASTTVSWNTQNVSTCTKSGSWSGNTGTSGVETVDKLAADVTYTLTCKGSKIVADISKSVSVHVLAKGVVSTSTIVTTPGSGMLTVTQVPTQNSNGTINPTGLTREQLIQAIIAKIQDLIAQIKAIRGY